MRKQKKTRWLALPVALFMLALLIACGSTDSSTRNIEKTSEASRDETVTDQIQSTTSQEEMTTEQAFTATSQEEMTTGQTSNAGSEEKKDNNNDQSSDSAASTATGTAAETLADEPLSSGKIAIDGEVYQLGMTYNQISDGKWTLNDDDYAKYENYTLNPRTTSGSGVSLFSDQYGRELGCFSIVIAMENASEDSISLFDGAIDYIAAPQISRVESAPVIELPGGLTTDSKLDDFKAAYGEPYYEYSDDSTKFESYNFTNGDVEISVKWINGRMNEINLSK